MEKTIMKEEEEGEAAQRFFFCGGFSIYFKISYIHILTSHGDHIKKIKKPDQNALTPV